MPSQNGPAIGPYALEGELGRGGMGVVYKARHVALNRPVAIKLLLGGQAADPLRRERFRLEAQAAARLRHPNLVALHDVGEAQGCPYLVMDLVEGGSLQDLLDRDGPPAPRRAAALAEKVARALDAAHEALILHRDVKPANVLLDAKGEPLLTDFGLAKRLESAEKGPTRTGQLMGTPGFAPPEQIGGGAIDVRADVYGVGALLYALLTGRPPFEGETALEVLAKVAGLEPEPPSWLRAELRAERDLETICLRCLEKRPEDRYLTARALADDLARYLAHEPIAARRPSVVDRVRKWTRRNRSLSAVLVAASALLLLTALGAVGWAARERERARLEARAGAERDHAAARASLASVGSGDGTTAALELLESAQRWHAQAAPGDVEAVRAHFDAALALGEVGQASGQWALARHGFSGAAGLGVDDALARSRLEALEVARTADALRRRQEVEGWLARAASGELARRPDGLQDAVFAIVRYPEPQTVEVLAAALTSVADDLLEAEATWLRESAKPTPDLEDAIAVRRATPPGVTLPAAARATLSRARSGAGLDPSRSPLAEVGALAVAQRHRVGQGRLDLARVAAEALGRLGVDEAPGPLGTGGAPGFAQARARDALAAYLRVEADPLRAVPAGLALARLPGPEARALVHWSLRFFGANGPYGEQVERAVRGSVLATASEEPTTAPAWIERAMARQAEGDLGGAIADFDRALALDPEDEDAWNGRGVAHKLKGDRARAIADFTRAIELSPGFAAAWSNRGDLRRLEGDLAGALEDSTRAIELNVIDPGAWSNRGGSRMAQGDLDGAIADFTRALELAPLHAMWWSNRGVARRARGDLAGAVADLTRALELDPRDARVWTERGGVRSAAGDTTGALADHARALELDPASALAWTCRGVTRQAANDLVGAIEDYTRAVEFAPRDAQAWRSRGLARHAQRDFQGAISDLDRAIELEPRAATAWLGRGYARYALSDRTRARADLLRFLELAPTDPNAPAARALLRDQLRE